MTVRTIAFPDYIRERNCSFIFEGPQTELISKTFLRECRIWAGDFAGTFVVLLISRSGTRTYPTLPQNTFMLPLFSED